MSAVQALVSVRDEAEAMTAVQGGAHFIDLKEPLDGALGALPLDRVREVLAALQALPSRPPVSATIGDLPMSAHAEILRRVAALGGCGVDYVKVGIEPGVGARNLLVELAECGQRVVPVFIADRGVDRGLVDGACALGFPGLMLDTAQKGAGSLLDRVGPEALRAFVAMARGAGKIAGLAGALRIDELPALRALAPDFAGFRSAVCAGGRSATLDASRVRAVVAGLRVEAPVGAG